MQNNSRISVFLLVACTGLTTIFTQVYLMKATPSIGQETTTSTPLLARVVHDPDEGKAPPPT
jgi:hypothetical protein